MRRRRKHKIYLEKKMIQRIASSIIPAWFLSVAILISAVHYNVAHAAQDNPKKHGNAVALACGKEIKKTCSGSRVDPGLMGADRTAAPVANSVLGCFQKSQEKLSARCAALAMSVVDMCDSDAARLCSGVVAGPEGNIVGCLTMARNVVSPQCNAALDAASLR
jgi:hypothetical protein